MATMEGPLSKWTNVMKGWQYRWFVLDESSGLLSYYTSKEKMMRGSRRGCVRLKGAVIGIDDEDDSTFTITVDQKTFHFQARDAEEREKWIDALEDTIVRHSQPLQKVEYRAIPSDADLDRKLAEADAYLQILIDQVKDLSVKIEQCEDVGAKEKYSVIKITAEAMIESIKEAIVVMQVTRQSTIIPALNGLSQGRDGHVEEAVEVRVPTVSLSVSDTQLTSNGLSVSSSHTAGSCPSGEASRGSSVCSEEKDVSELEGIPAGPAPATSYSSDEDDFFDAEEFESPTNSRKQGALLEVEDAFEAEEEETEPSKPTVIASKNDHFDELYDDMDDEDLGSLDQHGSIITHLLSQVRIGMDLTKIVLPTFILERRSLLEMYADFFAHPDLFVSIADMQTPKDRMVQVVRWYLSAFHAGRRSDIAKKPYNPILGETFRCYWDVPNSEASEERVDEGPVPWAHKNNVTFIAEQVSHHPPISAFYAEHCSKRISLDGYIWTKSKFLGLSIGVHMIGQAVISVIDYDEEYIITFPNGYGRSILTIPWVELGGKIQVTCAKTGYSANIEFLTKPFYGGKKNQVKASIFNPSDKKNPFCNIQGEWNGVMWAQYSSGMSEKFVDTKKMAIVKKNVLAINEQGEYESRRLWKDVTYHLKQKNVEQATEGKRFLEQRQREEAKERKEKGEKWETKFFHEVGEHWVYDKPIQKRLQEVQQVAPLKESSPEVDSEYDSAS